MTAIPIAAIAVLAATTVAGAIAVAFLLRSRAAFAERAESQAARAASAEERETALHGEIRHLVTVRLPAYAHYLVSPHYPVPGPVAPALAETEVGKLLEAVLRQFGDAILEQRRRIDAAAWAAVRGTSLHTLATANRMQDLLDALQRRYEDPELLQKCFDIDHLNEQIRRELQKAAIASGGWPGHVREPTHVPDVVAGAMSRLQGMERIRIVSRLRATNVGVVGPAAEPIAVACAELMANALEHSSDDLMVEVLLLQTDNGSVAVVIDDAGTGMTPEERARGARLASGEGALDLLLTELGDPPALGFPAIGRLVASYGFQVSVDQLSPYNGVRAVLTIPQQLLEYELTHPVSAMAPLPTPPPRNLSRPSRELADECTPAHDADLPQRRRKRPHTSSTHTPPAPGVRTPDPAGAEALWSDFQSGLNAASTDADIEER